MPWKERSVVEERMRFVLRLKDGESMASLCREFGISRVTGYKIYERYKECGLKGLTDRARTPYRYANKLPRPDRSNDCHHAARQADLGRSQASGTAATQVAQRCPSTRLQHHPRHHGPPWAGYSAKALSHKNRRYPFIRRTRSECFVVHRLQGRVYARGQKILLPPYRLGLRQPLSFAL